MPIVLANEVNPALSGALNYLSGRSEAARKRREREEELALRKAQQEQERAAQEARDKLQRDLQGQQGDLQRYAIDTRSRDARRAQEMGLAADQSQLVAQAGMRQDQIAASLLGNVLDGQQRMALQGQQLGLRGGAAQNQQELAALQGDVQLRNKFASFQLPEEVQQGINQGFLKYTPDQKTELSQLDKAINRLKTDPRMSPADRMRGELMLREQRHAILNSPTEVPPDERPKGLSQMFDEETAIVEIDGRPTRVFRGERNGVPDWKIIEPPKDEAAKMQLEDSKAERQFYRDTIRDDHKLQSDRTKNILDMQREIVKHKAQLASIKANAATNETKIDTSDFERTITEMQLELERMKLDGAPQSTLPSPPPMNSPAMEQQPMDAPAEAAAGPPQWYIDLPSGAEYTDPEGNPRTKR